MVEETTGYNILNIAALSWLGIPTKEYSSVMALYSINLSPRYSGLYDLPSNLFGTGDDLPANYGTFSDANGSIYTIHHWAYDSNEGKIIICHINTSQATHTRFCKISVTGIYDDNSSRYKNGNSSNI